MRQECSESACERRIALKKKKKKKMSGGKNPRHAFVIVPKMKPFGLRLFSLGNRCCGGLSVARPMDLYIYIYIYTHGPRLDLSGTVPVVFSLGPG